MTMAHRRRRRHRPACALVALALTACAGSGTAGDGDGRTSDTPSAPQQVRPAPDVADATLESTVPDTTAAPDTTVPDTTTVPAPTDPIAFESGMGLMVGTDIVPGLYIAQAGKNFCEWSRQTSVDTSEHDGISQGQIIVEILAVDDSFDADSSCGTWTPFSAPAAPASTISEGHWAVGTQILPGTYTTDGTDFDFCYWERSTGFLHDDTEIIINDITMEATTVTIEPSDVRFVSSGCGTWTLIP